MTWTGFSAYGCPFAYPNFVNWYANWTDGSGTWWGVGWWNGTSFALTGLTPNHYYNIEVYPYCSDGDPTTPSYTWGTGYPQTAAYTYANIVGPTITAASGTSLYLTSYADSNASGADYYAYTLPDASWTSAVASYSAGWISDPSTTLISSLSKNKYYYFYMQSRNVSDEGYLGAYSQTIAITQPADPGAPSGTYTSSDLSGSWVCPKTHIKWTWAAESPLSGVSGYTIADQNSSYGTSVGNITTWVEPASGSNGIAGTPLAPATSYQRKIRVTAAAASASYTLLSSQSSYSTSAGSGKTYTASASDVATGLTAAPASDTSISYSWSPAPNNCSFHYEVYLHKDDQTLNPYYLAGTADGATYDATVTYTATGLIPNTPYTAEVFAKDTTDSSTSNASTVAGATTYAAVPGVPTATAIGGATVRITFTANSNPDGTSPVGSNVTEYNVYGSRDGGTTYTTMGPWSSSLTRDFGILKSTKYYFKVKARNVNRIDTAFSGASTEFISQPTTPGNLAGIQGPASLGYCPKTDISFSWDQITIGSGGNGKYRIRSLSPTPVWDTGTAPASLLTTNSYVKTGLTPGTQYGVVVQSYDAGALWNNGSGAGFSDDSSLYYITTDINTQAPSAVTGAGQADGVLWNWTAPPMCSGGQYKVKNMRTGLDNTPIATPSWSQTGLGANALSTIAVRAKDPLDSDWSALSTPATTYSLPNTPTTLNFTGITTTGFTATWDNGLNPSYTRYVVTYSPDAFASTTYTYKTLSDNFTGNSFSLTNLTPGTLYTVRVKAYSGRMEDNFGGLPGSGTLSAALTTTPTAPVLTGTPTLNSITWSWTAPLGAAGYNLLDGAGAPIVSATTLTSYTTPANLPKNTRYDAQIEAYTSAPVTTSQRGTAFTFTLADSPTSATSVMGVNSAVFSWGANGNPASTYYEFSYSLDPVFSAAYVNTVNVANTQVTITDLLPGINYYARVRAFNGVQIPAPAVGYVSFPTAATILGPDITVNTGPVSPYVLPAGIAGSWQFDEGSGLSAADGSGNSNTISLSCASTLCTSTPTFVAGPTSLGTALSFQGQNNVRALSAAPLTFANDLTVEAWVYPETASQTNGAAIAARGNQGSEEFSLDVYSGKFRFLAAPAKTVSASASITAGAWTHVAGVYDSTTRIATLYVNGAAGTPSSNAAVTRTDSGQKLSLGNRPDSGGNYTLPFFGRIDALRVVNRALSASEVLADYQGSFVSTVTPSSPNNNILVGLPPNALNSSSLIYISKNPLASPIRIPSAALSAGMAVTPSTLTMISNTLTEVVPIVNYQAYVSALGSSATISIPYPDADNDNLIDGTSPPLAASSIRMYTLNTTVNRWEELPTTIDSVNHRAVGVTPHFSVFALFAPNTVAANLSSVRVYPVPWKPGTGGRFDSPGVIFDRLPASGRIVILNMAGEHVADLRFNGASAGSASWDGLSTQGRRCASGVYFAKVVSETGGSTIVKFAVER